MRNQSKLFSNGLGALIKTRSITHTGTYLMLKFGWITCTDWDHTSVAVIKLSRIIKGFKHFNQSKCQQAKEQLIGSCTQLVIWLLQSQIQFELDADWSSSSKYYHLIGRSQDARDGGQRTAKWKWNSNNSYVPTKKWITSKGRLFVPENFRLRRPYHFHFNRLNRKFRLNWKRPWKLI